MKETTQKWIDALRSGKYEQNISALRSNDNKFCCLGVLCDIYDPTKWRNFNISKSWGSRISYPTIEASRVYYPDYVSNYIPEFNLLLSCLNDEKFTFDD